MAYLIPMIFSVFRIHLTFNFHRNTNLDVSRCLVFDHGVEEIFYSHVSASEAPLNVFIEMLL